MQVLIRFHPTGTANAVVLDAESIEEAVNEEYEAARMVDLEFSSISGCIYTGEHLLRV